MAAAIKPQVSRFYWQFEWRNCRICQNRQRLKSLFERKRALVFGNFGDGDCRRQNCQKQTNCQWINPLASRIKTRKRACIAAADEGFAAAMIAAKVVFCGHVKVRGWMPKTDEARLIPTSSLCDVKIEWVTFWKNIL